MLIGDARSLPLEALGLTARAYSALDAHGLRTAGDIADLKADELLSVPHFGRGCLADVRTALARRGLVLTPPDDIPTRVTRLERKVDQLMERIP